MKKITVNHVHGSLFAIIGVGNLMTGLTKTFPEAWLALIYVAPFVAMSAAFFIFNEKIPKKATGWILLLFTIPAIFAGDNGNITSATMLCFAFYLIPKRALIIAGITSMFAAIIVKAVISGFTVAQSLNYLAAHAWVLGIYFLVIHPKPLEVSHKDLDAETLETIRLSIKGKTHQEIADIQDISTAAVSKRITRAVKKVNAASVLDLAIMVVKTGQVSLK